MPDLSHSIVAARTLLSELLAPDAPKDLHDYLVALVFVLYHEEVGKSLSEVDDDRVSQLVDAAYRHVEDWKQSPSLQP